MADNQMVYRPDADDKNCAKKNTVYKFAVQIFRMLVFFIYHLQAVSSNFKK
jgi:hypothetical protein